MGVERESATSLLPGQTFDNQADDVSAKGEISQRQVTLTSQEKEGPDGKDAEDVAATVEAGKRPTPARRGKKRQDPKWLDIDSYAVKASALPMHAISA